MWGQNSGDPMAGILPACQHQCSYGRMNSKKWFLPMSVSQDIDYIATPKLQLLPTSLGSFHLQQVTLTYAPSNYWPYP